MESGDYTQAQQLFTEALQSGEQEMLAYRGLGLSCMGLAQYEDAEAAFTSALSAADDKMPENRLDLRLYLAAAQYRLAEYEKRWIRVRLCWRMPLMEMRMPIICAEPVNCTRAIQMTQKRF